VIVGVLGATAATAITACSSRDSAAIARAPRISDTAFEAAARGICRQAVRTFDTAPTLPKIPTNAERAETLDTIADTFSTMVAQLRATPVAAADRPAVAQWLAEWDQSIAFGRRYADAVRAGAEGAIVRDARTTSAQGELRRRLNAFAAANNLKTCVFP
jgi:hypothetical protein